MVNALPSYVQGSWFTPTQAGAPIRDASTGEVITEVTSAGISPADVLSYARTVGGPNLRSRTFRDRVDLIQALAKDLSRDKDEVYALAARAGNTHADAAFDIEGGLNALFVYASLGKAGLPHEHLLRDGDTEKLSKRGSFVGQHVYAPLHGAAVQINAYNFPVWGMLEKLAPAIIAGVPVIVKPASQTAYVAEAMARRIVDSGILPDGAFQLICGGVGDLFDHLTGQDVVAFTGSAATADKLRTHPTVVSQSVRFNAEADSLNSIILGADAGPSTPEFELFVAEVAKEMTHKAGQKCTAIRRAFVPEELAEPVVDALATRLSEVTVGAPGEDGVSMGPLVSLEQRNSVLSVVEQLIPSGRVAFGDSKSSAGVATDDAAGAFMSPVLMVAEDPAASAPHELEAFGPVCTVFPYGSIEEAVELTRRGRGSLVATVVTHDRSIAERFVGELAPWHGRLLLLDRTSAAESTGHGAALAQLVHGGPGRAGGGEELGGLRGVHRYLQRTALQGSPDMISRIANRWVTGAELHTDGVHPFRKYADELQLGDSVTAGPREITLSDIEQFAELTGDTFYAHMDEEAAKANPFFEGRVAHGYLVVAVAAGLFVDPDPGPVLANYGVDRLRFLTPVNPGDELTVTLTVKELRPRRDYAEVSWDAVVVNQKQAPVAEYDVLTMVANRPAD